MLGGGGGSPFLGNVGRHEENFPINSCDMFIRGIFFISKRGWVNSQLLRLTYLFVGCDQQGGFLSLRFGRGGLVQMGLGFSCSNELCISTVGVSWALGIRFVINQFVMMVRFLEAGNRNLVRGSVCEECGLDWFGVGVNIALLIRWIEVWLEGRLFCTVREWLEGWFCIPTISSSYSKFGFIAQLWLELSTWHSFFRHGAISMFESSWL